MKIICKSTNETVSSILTNHGMTLDDAILAAGGEIINDMTDYRFSDDGDNVIIGSERYWWDDLDIVSDNWSADEDND